MQEIVEMLKRVALNNGEPMDTRMAAARLLLDIAREIGVQPKG